MGLYCLACLRPRSPRFRLFFRRRVRIYGLARHTLQLRRKSVSCATSDTTLLLPNTNSKRDNMPSANSQFSLLTASTLVCVWTSFLTVATHGQVEAAPSGSASAIKPGLEGYCPVCVVEMKCTQRTGTCCQHGRRACGHRRGGSSEVLRGLRESIRSTAIERRWEGTQDAR